MDDLYNVDDLDLWYLGDSAYTSAKRVFYRKTRQTQMKVYALYLCEGCNHVWEVSWTGSIVKYKHLPTYGLKKRECKICANGHNRTYQSQRDLGLRPGVKRNEMASDKKRRKGK